MFYYSLLDAIDIRPILRGRDIKRYQCDFNDLWIINAHNGVPEKDIKRIEIEDYPAVKDYLSTYYESLCKRSDKGDTPWNLRSCAYLDDFSSQKIMYNDITQKLSFTLVPANVFCLNTVYFIKNNSHIKYLLAYLNSKIVDWYYRTLSVQLGEKAVRMFSIYVLKIPVPQVTEELEYTVNEYIDCLLNEKADITDIDNKINSFFYKIFDLSQDEVEYIEKAY